MEEGDSLVWYWLELWGYDEYLYPIEERTFHVSMHAQHKKTL